MAGSAEGARTPTRRLRIGVLFGGRSGEHEVSLHSARAVVAALELAGHEVVPIGITRHGRWLVGGDPLAALSSGAAAGEQAVTMLPEPDLRGALIRLEDSARAHDPERTDSRGSGPDTSPWLERSSPAQSIGGRLDVVFPVLHGTYGEDGTVQGLFDLASVPYVGAGVLGSALGMDKVVQKTLWRGLGLPVVDFVWLTRGDFELNPEAALDRIEAAFEYPCFGKPANLGSSVGVTRARDRDELRFALHEAARYDAKLLVERGLSVRELEVAVLGNDDPTTSVVGEIIPGGEFYDYRAKYLDTGSVALIPADIPPETAREVQRLAVTAFKSIDAAGLARVDFFLERGTERLYLNEINTMPGFTTISMYPKLWEASGLPFPQLVDRLVELAVERAAERARNETSYRAD